MKYLLDTNAVIALLNQNQNFIAKLQAHKPSDFGVPSIVMFELYFGAEKSQRRAENLAKLKKLPFEIVPFDFAAAQTAGKIRSNLEKQGTPIGGYDVQIAGVALSQKLILITHNVKEFERVEGLRFEDWLK